MSEDEVIQGSFQLASLLKYQYHSTLDFLHSFPTPYTQEQSAQFTTEIVNMANGAIAANEHPAPHGVNGQTSAIGITTHGSDWYWVCSICCCVCQTTDGT